MWCIPEFQAITLGLLAIALPPYRFHPKSALEELHCSIEAHRQCQLRAGRVSAPANNKWNFNVCLGLAAAN
jgi:hypothetical protein